jgi:diguanylate cyclase (GGDEF)-like protein
MKWINDNLGHTAGDEALVETASVLHNTFRKSDIIGIGRLGGDEFAVLMFSEQGTCCDHPVLDRFEENITKLNKQPDRKYLLSMSVGIVQYDPERPCTTEEFISRGDEAMYKCKRERKRSPA